MDSRTLELAALDDETVHTQKPALVTQSSEFDKMESKDKQLSRADEGGSEEDGI
jgi:hypothetical protein